MGNIRKPGGGRKKLKPEFDAGKNLKEQMESAVVLYEEDCSLQDIADALNLNPIKVRKLLITAGVYESDMAENVQDTFEKYRETQSYKEAILSTAAALELSKASVTSYLHRLVIHEAVHPFTPRMRPAANMSYIFYRIVTRVAVGLQIA